MNDELGCSSIFIILLSIAAFSGLYQHQYGIDEDLAIVYGIFSIIGLGFIFFLFSSIANIKTPKNNISYVNKSDRVSYKSISNNLNYSKHNDLFEFNSYVEAINKCMIDGESYSGEKREILKKLDIIIKKHRKEFINETEDLQINITQKKAKKNSHNLISNYNRLVDNYNKTVFGDPHIIKEMDKITYELVGKPITSNPIFLKSSN